MSFTEFMMRPIGGMTADAQKLFDHIHDAFTKAEATPGQAPEGQPTVITPPTKVVLPATIQTPETVIPADFPWMINAKKELGVTEVPGAGNNPRILWYHSFCTLKASYDSIAWCSAFANAMMISSGFKGTRSAAALDWVNTGWGRELKYAEYGCLVVYDWGNGHGHVGFCADLDDEKGVLVLGGNQTASDGQDKVCKKWFSWNLNLISCKWPKEFPLPKGYELDNS